jgi:O-antigen/teichoic acid export membrane protein
VSIRRIAFGTAAMSMVNVLRLFVQFFAIPILARKLSPTDYGLVGMAMPILAFSMMIADAGIGMSLVRSSATSQRVWSTCFWLSAVLGVVLSAGMIAAAPLAGRIMHQPELSPIVMALALALLIQAIAIIPSAMLQKRQQFNAIALIEIGSIAIGIGAAIAVATQNHGAWALVIQQLSYAGVKLAATFLVSPFRPRFALDFSNVTEHLTFSRDILAINLIVFFTRSIDNLIIGAVLGAAAVGVYSMTWQFVRLPLMLVTGPLQYVLYAQLANIKHDRAATRRLLLILTRLVATLAFPTIGMIAVAHDSIFGVLLSKKWAESGDLFMMLAPVSALQAITAIAGTFVLSIGRTDIQIRWTTECGIIWLIMLIAAVWSGLDCIAIAQSALAVLYAPRLLALMLPLMGCDRVSYGKALLTPVMASLLGMGGFIAIINSTHLGQFAQFCLAAALAAGCVALSVFFQRAALVGEMSRRRGRDPTDNSVALNVLRP